MSLYTTTTQLIERHLSYSRQPFGELLLVSPWISVASDVRDSSEHSRNTKDAGYGQHTENFWVLQAEDEHRAEYKHDNDTQNVWPRLVDGGIATFNGKHQ